jgi:hypothetical protein
VADVNAYAVDPGSSGAMIAMEAYAVDPGSSGAMIAMEAYAVDPAPGSLGGACPAWYGEVLRAGPYLVRWPA